MTVDEYLEGAPEPHRSTLADLRATLRELLPRAEESISYGMPAFKVRGEVVAGYAYWKRHCSYFPHSGSVLPALVDELDGYQWSKGTLRFAVDAPLPRALVERLVDVRLEQLGLAGGA
jgi:uncharacterized protein YdhG (YjbR/CyaY superfamily)